MKSTVIKIFNFDFFIKLFKILLPFILEDFINF